MGQKSNPSDCRAILWKKLTAMGFGGTKFLASLQAMYTGDNITCKVAGVTTRPVYLTRGLRQVDCFSKLEVPRIP